MGRASRRKRSNYIWPELSSSPLAAHPPRQVSKTGYSDNLLVFVSLIFPLLFLGGPVFLRLAAISFGVEVIGIPTLVQTHKNLKGRKTTILKVSFYNEDRQLIHADFAVGLGDRSRFLKKNSSINQVKVKYVRGAPWISGLVDDFGYSKRMLSILFTTAFALLVLLYMPTIYKKWKIEPKQKELLANGTVVQLKIESSFLRFYRIYYQHEGHTYRHWVSRSRIWSAKSFREGKFVLVDPNDSKRFMIYGDGVFTVDPPSQT